MYARYDNRAQRENGRVSFAAPPNGANGAPFFLFSQSTPAADSAASDSLRGGIDASATSDAFFSRDNIDALQEGIRYTVFVRSGARKYVISRQSEEELLTVMRSVYLQYATNTPGVADLEEVRRLNGRVIDYCAPRILSELVQHSLYMRDLQQLPVPMGHGEFVSSKGSRSLAMPNRGA
jgi:hypothetical protein